jgi:hypothetical protein
MTYRADDCTDTADCQCLECVSGRVCNLRVALIECIAGGTLSDVAHDKAIAVVTHSYGSDRWMLEWGVCLRIKTFSPWTL